MASWIENLDNLAQYGSRDFLTQVKLGNVPGHRLIHKFGKNTAVGTSPVPVAVGSMYRTPVANTALEFVSDDAADSAAGLGAQEVTVQGLVLTDGAFVHQEEAVETNGITAVAFTNEFIRVFRAWISRTGTYAGMTAVSSPGTLTIQESGGGDSWLEIAEFVSGSSDGQSQTAMYTTPSASTSILYAPYYTIESGKDVSMYLFNRPNADDVTAPFSGARRMALENLGLQAPHGISHLLPVSKFTGATDIGFLAEVALGTAKISAGFWLLEIEDGY